MRNTILAILLLFATQSDAGCGKLCDFRWWETVTETALLAGLAVDDVVMGRTEFGDTALHYAARYGSPKHIKILLEAGANVNAFNLSGSTPLIAASESTKNVEVLLEGGADIHAQNRLGDTALFYASYAEDPINVKKLLKAGADVNQRNNANWTPLHYAARIGHPSVVEALLNAGANVESQSQYGTTPLQNWASSSGWEKDPRTLDLLLNAGAKVNAQDALGDTILHRVLETQAHTHPSNAQKSIFILLRHGANVLTPNNNGKSPWDYAQSEDFKGTQAYWALNDARYKQMSD